MTSFETGGTTTTPLHERLYEIMRGRIDSGVWAEGEKVPSEQDLIGEFGTSRAPIRQALARLRSEGAIAGGRGAPSRVRRRVATQSFQTFMSFTDWARGLDREPGQRVVSASRHPATDGVAEVLGVEPGEAVVEILRLRLLDGAAAMLERSAFPLAVGIPLLAADLDTDSIYETMRDHGDGPDHASHTFDAVLADAVDAPLLGVPEGSPLLRVRRVSWDPAGRLVEFADDRYLPTRANFTIENSSTERSRLLRNVAS